MSSKFLSIGILFMSVLKCNSDMATDKENITLSFISTKEDPEPLPQNEALSFLRPTIVRGPPAIQTRYDQMASYSDIDRIDTVHSPRYINPIPINREFGSVPFGYRTVPLRRATTFHPGQKVSRPRKINSDSTFDSPDIPLHRKNYSPKNINLFKGEAFEPPYVSYDEDIATLEGSGLFKYITTDELDAPIDPFGTDREFIPQIDRGDIFDAKTQELEGSLQSALKSLWKYKKLAYETLLARSGSVEKETKRNTEDEQQWSKVWKRPLNQRTRENARYSETSQNNMPFGDPLGRITHSDNQKTTRRYRNPTHIPKRQGSSMKKQNTATLYSRYPSDSIKKRRDETDEYTLVPRVTDGYSRTRPPYGSNSGNNYRRTTKTDHIRNALYDNRYSSSRGTNLRTPRMQLVKQVNKPIDDNRDFDNIINLDDKNTNLDDKTNIIDEIKRDEKTVDENDVLILNVPLVEVDKIDEEEENEYYAYYVEDDLTNLIDRMGDESDDFYYYDESDEISDKNVDKMVDGEGYIEFEYVDDEEYGDDPDEYDDGNDDVTYVYSSTKDVDSEGNEDNSDLSKRQGLFDFPIFGGKKRLVKKKRIRPKFQQSSYPHSSDGNRYLYGSPKPEDVYHSSSDETQSTTQSNDALKDKKTKNIRVRIKSNPNKKRKKIRMKIMELKDIAGSQPGIFTSNDKQSTGPIIITTQNNLDSPNLRPVNVAYGTPGIIHQDHQPMTSQGGTRTKGYTTTFKKVHLNTGLGGSMNNRYGPKKNAGPGNKKVLSIGGSKNTGLSFPKPSFGGLKSSGFGDTKNTGYGYGPPMPSGYGGKPSPGQGGSKFPGVKDTIGWSAMTSMSDNLPDLNKAITIMSFIAFSVFVANLGVNALANSSLGIQFGRGDPNFFNFNPDFNLETMIKKLDLIFEEEDNVNGTRVSTFQKLTDFVSLVYDDLHETTRREMENVRDKITNFLDRNFSGDDLPVGDISKGFLARNLDEGLPFGDLEDTCYRRLLCLAHNLTMEYNKEDKRNQLLPFWTFGIGWLKGGESNIVNLLENLRAELAGQTGRDCRELFTGCGNETLVEELAEKVETELKEDTDSKIDLEIDLTEENAQNYDNIIVQTTTHRSTSPDESFNIELQLNNVQNQEN